MSTPTTRILSPSRIVALVVIAVMISGLLYVGLAPDSASVSVPEGAKAGELVLEPCDYATEGGTYAADCGTLSVPENRADPQSRLIALPVTRIRARSGHPAEPIFRLEGGPGLTNMRFSLASRFADNHDIVLVGYRGVDGSSVLDCPEVTSALRGEKDILSEKSFGAYADAFRSCASRLNADGVDLAGYSLAQQVDDLEAVRVAMGYDRIDLLSESAGTRTAMIYSWRYPTSIHRSVMIGANPPGHYFWDENMTDEQLRRYSELCAQDDKCSQRTDDLAASMGRTTADMPDRWGLLPIKEANVRVASFFGLFETTSKIAVANGPATLDSWLSAAEGDASGLWLASLVGDVVFPKSFVWGQYAAIGTQDAHVADPYYTAGGDRGSLLGNPATNFVWAGGRFGAAWPTSPDDAEYSQVRTSPVETLVVSGELDFSTPPQAAAKELMPHLPNGHQVVLPAFGHSGSIWKDQPEAGTHLITTFFASGRVDSSRYQPATIDFTPGATLTALAKRIVTIMVGVALLAVLSLAWMARRVQKRGRLGTIASVTLRSAFPIVLGAGGWFLGVLIVLTTMPGVPFDSDLLAAVSIGVPIGLGVYLAWVDREWSATTKRTGLAAAAGGALVGAWLGFNATEGLVAVLTTIVGATVGANLIVLALDIAWDWEDGSRIATDDTGGATDRMQSVRVG